MSSVIDFLEELGKDAALNGAATNDLQSVLKLAELSADERAAILGGGAELATLLGLQGTSCALIHAPEDDEEDETEDEPKEDEDDNGEPGQERAALVRDAAAA